MTDDEFDEFLDEAMHQLEHKQADLADKYGFGRGGRWHFDQETQCLELFDAQDHLTASADVIDIGSFASGSGTWMWAWSDDSVLPGLRLRARPLLALESLTGFEMFGKQGSFKISGEPMAWELAAIAVMHLGALGCYRAPESSGRLMSFLAIMSVEPSAN